MPRIMGRGGEAGMRREEGLARDLWRVGLAALVGVLLPLAAAGGVRAARGGLGAWDRVMPAEGDGSWSWADSRVPGMAGRRAGSVVGARWPAASGPVTGRAPARVREGDGAPGGGGGRDGGYFIVGSRMAEWFTEPEQRMSFYAGVADTVSLVAKVDQTKIAGEFSRCAPYPDLPGDIPFLTPSWYGSGELGLARVVIEQVVSRCPGPGVDVVSRPLIKVKVLDTVLRGTRYLRDGHLMVMGCHDAIVALGELDGLGELVRTFRACAARIRTVEDLVNTYQRREGYRDPEDPAVVGIIVGVLEACMKR